MIYFGFERKASSLKVEGFEKQKRLRERRSMKPLKTASEILLVTFQHWEYGLRHDRQRNVVSRSAYSPAPMAPFVNVYF
jgi:hypothetical protein